MPRLGIGRDALESLDALSTIHNLFYKEDEAMKAITILQPYASLIACGAKKIETRSWPTKYRGTIAIHAGLSHKYSGKVREAPFYEALCHDKNSNVCYKWDSMPDSLPYGIVIAIADLIDCIEINESHIYYLKLHLKDGVGNEYAFGDYEIGRYAWILDNVRKIDPVPAKGMQRLWEWEE
jgi:hypothetical protein